MTTLQPAHDKGSFPIVSMFFGLVMLAGGVLLWGFATQLTSRAYSMPSGDIEEAVGGAFLHFLALLLMGVGLALATLSQAIAWLVAIGLVVATILLRPEASSFFLVDGFFGDVSRAFGLAMSLGALIPIAVALIGPRRHVPNRKFIGLLGALATLVCLGLMLFHFGLEFVGLVGGYGVLFGVLAGVMMWSVIFGARWFVLIVLAVPIAIGFITTGGQANTALADLHPGARLAISSAAYGVWTLLGAGLLAVCLRFLPAKAATALGGVTVVTVDASGAGAGAGVVPGAGTPVIPGYGVPGHGVPVAGQNAGVVNQPRIAKAPRGFSQPGEPTPL